ncbi:P-loop containing nucleoside triphosphate hydrolase protein, partial [Dactylonectria macrodidyma]
LVNGAVRMPAVATREQLTAGSNTRLTDSVAFCAQEAWLTDDTVRNNIIFGRDFDDERYEAVLGACALLPDLAMLSQRDLTFVGDGGQKQRVALARALYSTACHLLLDDYLSAVENHTASCISRQCIAVPNSHPISS